jgi:hypothetical protein
MNQWISTVNSYYYPYMIYHVSHERNVFPELGIPSDENVVAHALPKIEVGLKVAESSWRTAKTTFSVPNSRLRTSTCCQASIHLASPRKPRPCIPSTRAFPAGARRWKDYTQSRSFVPHYHRAHRLSTPENGLYHIGRNIKASEGLHLL